MLHFHGISTFYFLTSPFISSSFLLHVPQHSVTSDSYTFLVNYLFIYERTCSAQNSAWPIIGISKLDEGILTYLIFPRALLDWHSPISQMRK